MIERRPALIVRCAEADDVPHTISFARENGLEISIRGAGHNIAGNAVCDHGVMIDFSTMGKVRVDAEKKRVYVNLARHWPILTRQHSSTDWPRR